MDLDENGEVIGDFSGDSAENASKSVDDGIGVYLCPAANGWGSSCVSTGGLAGEDSGFGPMPQNLHETGQLFQIYAQNAEGQGTALGNQVAWPGPVVDPPPAPVPISDWSNTAQATAGNAPTLPPVLNLTVVVDGDNWRLEWDKFNGATSYELQVKHEPDGGWIAGGGVVANDNARQSFLVNYTGGTFVEFDLYSFRVRALGPA